MASALQSKDRILIGLGFIAVQVAPSWALLMASALVLHGRRFVCLWLPFAWAAGERLQVPWTSIANDWLSTQVDVAPVMRGLAYLGMWPTVLACLFVSASMGEVVARRSRALIVPAAVVAAAFMLLPRPAHTSDRLLAGMGVVHATSLDTMPSVEGIAELDLIVWPEVAFSARPPVEEGVVSGVSLDSPLGGAGPGAPAHLVGMTSVLLTAKQNAALAVDADGAITAMRAKRVLFPVFERVFLGRGENQFLPGKKKPLLRIAGRAVVPLVCGEFFTRELVAEGKAAGGEVIAVLASDAYQAGNIVAYRQVLAHARLRAIEYGMPLVYASRHGRAAFVGADGLVLGTSAADAPSGVLMIARDDGSDPPVVRDITQSVVPSAVVLYSQRSIHLRPDCPPGRCTYHPIEEFQCSKPSAASPNTHSGMGVTTVIVAGHAAPPEYLGTSAAVIADAVACFTPELVVVDTCFGASTPLLKALATRSSALVVGAPAFVAGRGFKYRQAFFEAATPEERAAAVSSVPAMRLFVGRPSMEAIEQAEADIDAASGDALRARVRSWVPTLVTVQFEPDQEIVAPADWRKIGRPPKKLRR